MFPASQQLIAEISLRTAPLPLVPLVIPMSLDTSSTPAEEPLPASQVWIFQNCRATVLQVDYPCLKLEDERKIGAFCRISGFCLFVFNF